MNVNDDRESSQEVSNKLTDVSWTATLKTECQQQQRDLKHLHTVETRFYCPHTFLYLDSQCGDEISELI